MADYNFENLKVEEVLELVANGEITAEEAIEIEKQGKNRTTLIKELTELLNDDVDSSDVADNEQEGDTSAERTIVTLNKNIKYNGQRFKVGEQIEINSNDVESFIKLGVIAGE